MHSYDDELNWDNSPKVRIKARIKYQNEEIVIFGTYILRILEKVLLFYFSFAVNQRSNPKLISYYVKSGEP